MDLLKPLCNQRMILCIKIWTYTRNPYQQHPKKPKAIIIWNKNPIFNTNEAFFCLSIKEKIDTQIHQHPKQRTLLVPVNPMRRRHRRMKSRLLVVINKPRCDFLLQHKTSSSIRFHIWSWIFHLETSKSFSVSPL